MPRRPSSEPGARRAACRILELVEAERGHSNALLSDLPDSMEQRERALATELVYGVLRRRSALDRAIAEASSRPLHEIDLAVLIALRLAVYQILHLNRVPERAAVNEAVAMVRARSGAGAAGFANALLRSICRARKAPRPAPDCGDPVSDPSGYGAHLAEEHCFPRFLVDRFLSRYGPVETEALLATLNRPAPIVLRPVRSACDGPEDLSRRLRAQGVETNRSPLLSGALRVTSGVAQRSALFREGAFYIQDEASQIVTHLLGPFEGEVDLLDLCAAPGGKILAATEQLRHGTGTVVAADRSRIRLRTLHDNAGRLGVEGILYVVMDARRPALRKRFNRVLLDAPCSGTGIIRRHPEIRWRREESQIHDFARRQAEALLRACDLVVAGGRLVYSVCSLEPEEGHERIAALLEARPEMELVDARPLLPPEARALVDQAGCLSTLPHRDDVDGFYAAVLMRHESVAARRTA